MQKTIYIIIFYFSIVFGAPSIHPMAKSLLMPGLGELDLGSQKSSRFFMQTEAILFTSCWSAYKFAAVKEKEYIAYANATKQRFSLKYANNVVYVNKKNSY